MRYRDILVQLDREPATDANGRRRAYAISLAAALDAHLTGLVFELEPQIPGLALGEMPVDFMEGLRRESAEGARRAADTFNRAAEGEGISYESRTVHVTSGAAPGELASQARVSDLVVIGQHDPDESVTLAAAMIEAALFESGRPVLIVPYIGYDSVRFGRIIVAWDGGREASRAAHDALPLLERAENVEVLVIGERIPAAQAGEPGADLAQHLARHGVKVTAKRINAPDVDVGNATLSHAADYGADLLVMGGYARSRLRQVILGGMTRSVLETMTLPVLMSH